MVAQTRHWCFTLNNYSAADDDALKALGPNVSYLCYGYETGEAGTPHLQGYVVFPRKKRLSEAKSLLPGEPHMEPKRGTPLQASDYCKKDGVFQEFGVLPANPGGASCFDSFIQWALSFESEHHRLPSDREIAREFPALWLRNERKLRTLAAHLCPPVSLMDAAQLRPWQMSLKEALLNDPPDDRGILFYVDPEGGCGKSFFQRYMLTFYADDVQLLSVAKRDDIAHAVDPSKRIFLFNIPRGGMEFLQYPVLEQLKDRVVFSPKYDSGTKVIWQNPHVVIFCNEMPDLTKMTVDRFKIINMMEEDIFNDSI